MIKIIGESDLIGTRLSKRITFSKKEFNKVDKVESKSFGNIRRKKIAGSELYY